MIFQVSGAPNSIGLICFKCKGAQLTSAPVVVSLVGFSGQGFRVNAPAQVLSQLRASRSDPGSVKIEGTITGGVLSASRVIGGVSARVARKVAAITEKVFDPPVEITAVTGRDVALMQLGITPVKEITMSVAPLLLKSVASRDFGDVAPPNEQRGFIHKKLGGLATGIISTIFPPVAPIISTISRFAGGGGPVAIAGPGCGPGTVLRNGRCEVVGIGGVFERLLPGGQPGQFPIATTGSGCPSGMHPNKSSYFTSAGFVEKGTKCVSNRRRNNLNPRAATRAASRLVGFTKDVKRVDKALRKIAGRR